ncbi:hypothetical protein DSO57_1019175 [Entomophthora muscae]|uniref:Uncharacterized protein n=1 Tax=Entomophthora muscae TaxID=34485 RepID=A0ACC2TRE9_9FUNG|nr:hypothetical protein DSO57_1019175 [Entomophthora muscae]
MPKGASKWAVTAYKDTQLVRLDPVSLNGVYCINSIELVWDTLGTLPFKNIPEMGQAMQLLASATPWRATVVGQLPGDQLPGT